MSCPFCDKNVIKSQCIFESKNCHVFYSIRPANKGQCIVSPKRHVENIRDLKSSELYDLIKTVKRVSEKFKLYLEPVGINYGFNEGAYAGQTVNHFHFHIMPRVEGDKEVLPNHHLFHRDPKTKRNLNSGEMKPLVEEFRKLLKE